MRQQKTRKNQYYSDTFKAELVKQIVSGKLSVLESSRQYEIGGSMTVYRWLTKYGTKEKEMKTSGKKEKPEAGIPDPSLKKKISQINAEYITRAKKHSALWIMAIDHGFEDCMHAVILFAQRFADFYSILSAETGTYHETDALQEVNQLISQMTRMPSYNGRK
ncbi:MAG: transposase [Bacteroidia bacterium]